MSKFKIGDKVIYLGGNNDFYITPGAIGTVSQIDKQGLQCKDWSKTPKNNSKYGWWASFEEVDLADKYLQQEEAKKLLGLKDV